MKDFRATSDMMDLGYKPSVKRRKGLGSKRRRFRSKSGVCMECGEVDCSGCEGWVYSEKWYWKNLGERVEGESRDEEKVDGGGR